MIVIAGGNSGVGLQVDLDPARWALVLTAVTTAGLHALPASPPAGL